MFWKRWSRRREKPQDEAATDRQQYPLVPPSAKIPSLPDWVFIPENRGANPWPPRD